MFMRISDLILLVSAISLAACSEAEQVSPDPVEEPGAEVVECAIGAGSSYAAECSVERFRIDGGDVLVVNHPGGGFRRFTLASDGSGLMSYDGADEATRSLVGDVLELAVGTDRYRFPARRLGSTPASEGGKDKPDADTPDTNIADNAGS